MRSINNRMIKQHTLIKAQLPPIQQWLVFTDMDGTLLNHHNYTYAAALPVLAQLKQANVPIILNSSKTVAELTSYHQTLALNAPLIAENGSIIAHFSDNRPDKLLGTPYLDICTILKQLRQAHGFKFAGFQDWDDHMLAKQTGLPLDSAVKARKRQASEPLLWQDSEQALALFKTQLEAVGLSLTRGGRFWHVMGQTDKVAALRFLRDDYKQQRQQAVFTIALGDGPNDAAMLDAADLAVVVANPHAQSPQLSSTTAKLIIHTQAQGDEGWAEAFNMLLNNSLA